MLLSITRWWCTGVHQYSCLTSKHRVTVSPGLLTQPCLALVGARYITHSEQQQKPGCKRTHRAWCSYN